ncbi:MAG: hypothetical protein MH252_18495, partial [Thermosynechococcaceae cyanobacterium MS004]|nr:hypothetical protein [Thermosynechococcaceae cyanobacterium MS004]
LAEVCQRRAQMMWGDWVDQHNTDGPIPDEDFLAGLVQKSMFLDISSLVRQPKSRRGTVVTVEDEGESVVEEVTKEQALLLAGAEDELEPDETWELQGYDEDIAAWAETVRGWLKRQGLESAAICQLQEETGLALVKLWLAGLLGGFGLEQCGGFYDGAGVKIGVFQ